MPYNSNRVVKARKEVRKSEVYQVRILPFRVHMLTTVATSAKMKMKRRNKKICCLNPFFRMKGIQARKEKQSAI